MIGRQDQDLVDAVRRAATPLRGDQADHAMLLELIADARFVLLGEASHGTHEFYRERARITRLLIEEKAFDAVAVEGDWPDAYRVNRFVRGQGDDSSATDALADFRRFPTWMWRNADVVNFIDWQRGYNAARPPSERTGFYGLDLYSLHSSMAAVLQHLDRIDPAAAQRARERYACFDAYGDDSQVYGLMVGIGGSASCEGAVNAMLDELRQRVGRGAPGASAADDEETFAAEQNARLVKNAESYYRSMYLSDVSSWNQRDTHMVEMLDALERHLRRRGRPPRIVVWAHNSHLGDSRATEMGWRRGELNVGQLVRERHGNAALLVGFTTHNGGVTAAADWGAPAEHKRIVPACRDSYEALLHATGMARFLLPLRGGGAHVQALAQPRLERAIGVIYRPDSERQSHYFQARLPQQFDAVLHFDTSRAVEPLERNAEWRDEDAPETYPSGV